jgi:phosphoserine phosphatase
LDRYDLARMLEDIPVIDDIKNTVNWFQRHGIPSAICTFACFSVGKILAQYGQSAR